MVQPFSHGGASDWSEKVLPLRKQAEVTNGWLKRRLETVLPEIMAREGIDMWIVSAREYNEDPVLMTLLPAWMLSARRRTILVFHRRGDGTVERLTLARAGLGLNGYYEGVWESEKEDQWACLGRIVRERDPKAIGINYSETFAFGDGLSHTEYEQMIAALGPEYALRTRGAERLAVGWLERRTPEEMVVYPGIVQITHGVIAEAFSSRVIHPGVTTASDVVWWMRQRMHDLGLKAWFHPSVSIQRRGERSISSDAVIQPGDLLHCDVGHYYLNLATDTQQNAYILKLGECDAPAGIKAALATGNRLQDILACQFVAGRSGNEILRLALEQARGEGIKATIYCHPLGYHGHAAGPTIGLVDAQQGVPGRGDYELFDDTAHAMELNIRQAIPEWDGQEMMVALEQTVLFSGGQIHFLDGRQTKLHLIQ